MKSFFVTILLMMSTLLFGGEFNLKTLNNNTIHIQDFEGNLIFSDQKYAKKPLMFFFFGTRCPFCEREIPQVIDLVKKKKIAVIGVQAQLVVDDETLEEFVHQEDINFEVLKSGDANKLVRYLQKRKMWVGGVPYYILVDKYGNLEPSDLDSVLEKLNF